MGNRAVIKPVGKNIGVYLHWNGGIDSVTAFLKYCELKGFRSFDDAYGMARFCQVVGNFFGGGLSVGIETDVSISKEYAEWLDNGIYVVKDWDIVEHLYSNEGREGYDLNQMLKEIDKKQPPTERLYDFLDAEEVNALDLKVGDLIFMHDYNGNYEKHRVVGIGEDRFVNGKNVLGVPYVDKWYSGPKNPNNYLHGKVRKVVE